MAVEETEEMCRRRAGTPRMSTSAQELMYLVKRFFEVQKSEIAVRIVWGRAINLPRNRLPDTVAFLEAKTLQSEDRYLAQYSHSEHLYLIDIGNEELLKSLVF